MLEDAAQAAGARLDGAQAGALGDVATFSFFPSKNLGCFGDGGAIATDSDEVAELARALRFHGSRDKQHFQYVGYNSRLDELQAAILRVLLPSLDGWCDGRRAAAEAYAAAGLGAHVGLPQRRGRRRPGVAPVRGHPPAGRRADRRARRARRAGARLLPHPAASPAGHGPLSPGPPQSFR